MKNNLKKDVILFVSIFCILALVAGGTYAYWVWNVAESDIVFSTGDIKDYIEYEVGNSHFVGDFKPSDNYCHDSVYSSITIRKTTPDLLLGATIKMDVNYVSDRIKGNGSEESGSKDVYWVVDDGETCSGDISSVLAYGSFMGKEPGTTIDLTPMINVTEEAKQYRVYIWVEDTNLSGETIDVNVWTQVDQIGYIMGDVNNDHKVDMYDYMKLKAYLFESYEFTSIMKIKSDMDKDGDIDSVDLEIMDDFIFALGGPDEIKLYVNDLTRKGDANLDGVVNLLDADIISKVYMLGDDSLRYQRLLNADVNGDGIIDQFDYIFVKRCEYNTWNECN